MLGLLTACGEGGTAPRLTPRPAPRPAPPAIPPVAGAEQSRRADATLDSLFGADASVLDSALAAGGRALDARAAAWLDSVATALAPDPTPSGAAGPAARVSGRLAAAILPGDATASRTFATRAVVPTRGGPRVVAVDYSYAVTVTPDRIQLDVVDTDIVHDAGPDGAPRPGGASSYLHVLRRAMAVAPCPDEAGRSVGSWKGEASSYGLRAAPALAGPERWTYKTVERGVATPVAVQVNDEAFRRSVDYHFAYNVEHAEGAAFLTGDAEIQRSGVAIADVPLEIGDDALSGVTGDYRAIADGLGAGDVHALHAWLGDDVLKTSALAQRVWRGGGCVEVQEPGGPVQPASPGARMTLRPAVVHKRDGTRPAVTVEARASGGTVSPEGAPAPAPATFTYTASPTGTGQVDFRSVSKRGIGVGTVRFTPVAAGNTFDYASTTSYAINSRSPIDDAITGEMHGTNNLASRLTFVPIRPDAGDDRAFQVSAVTEVRVNASGTVHSQGPEGTRRTGEASFVVEVDGTSHDPAPGAPAHDQVGPEQFPVVRARAGVLKLFRHAGRDYFALDLGLSGVVGKFNIRSSAREACRDPNIAPASTEQEEYDNTTRRHVSVVSDPGDCWPHSSHTRTREHPYAFGAIGLDRRGSDPTTRRSEMFIGTYDARTGLIEGSETHAVSECDEVNIRDPLQLKVLLSTVHPWNGTVRYEQGQCTLSYTVRWRFFVPPR